jgi:hypothetical protein
LDHVHSLATTRPLKTSAHARLDPGRVARAPSADVPPGASSEWRRVDVERIG